MIGGQREYGRRGDSIGVAQPMAGQDTRAAQPSGGGLADYREGIKGLGDIMQVAARGYREAKTEEVDDQLLWAEGEFARWRDEWTAAHRGKDAGKAMEAFTGAQGEIGREAMARFGGENDEIFRDLLAKRLREGNARAMKDGMNYARGEAEAFSQSQWAGQLAGFGRMVQERPEDGAAIAHEAESLLASWRLKNPGKDASAMRLQLEDIAASGRIETLIAQGRLAEARQALSEGLAVNHSRGAGGAGSAAAARGGGQAGQAGRGHTIAEDFCNPLNLKRPGSNEKGRAAFQVFQTDQEGFAAAWNQLKRYKHGKRSLQTPRQMIAVWAPESDGNNHARYCQIVKDATGLDLDAPIDIDDPKTAALLMKGMALAESPLGGRYSPADIQGMITGQARQDEARKQAEGSPALGRPEDLASGKIPESRGAAAGNIPLAGLGMSPLKAAQWEKRIDDLEAREAAAQAQALKGPIDQFFAKAKAGVVADIPFTEAQLTQAMGIKGQALYGQMLEEWHWALNATELSAMPAPRQELLLEAMKPDAADPEFIRHKDQYDRMAKMIEADRRERAADPVAYVAAHDPKVAEAWNTFQAEPSQENFTAYCQELFTGYEQRGIAPEPGKSAPVLNKHMGAALARQVNMANDPALEMTRLREAAGPYYEQLMDQVAPQLGRSAMLIASGIDSDTSKSIMEARQNPNFIRDARATLNLQGPEGQGFDLALTDTLDEITRTFAQGGDPALAQTVRENVQIQALQLMMKERLDADEAVEKAAKQVILDRYEIVESPSGGLCRIPKEAVPEPDKVPEQMEKWISKADVSSFNMYFPGGIDYSRNVKRFRNDLKRRATYIPNYNESGLLVFYGSFPLLDRNGNPIVVKWDELK